VLDRECVGAVRCALLGAAGFVFQACSIDHSDISPHLESTSCGRSASDYRTRRRIPNRFCILFAFSGLKRAKTGVRLNCVRPSNVLRSLTAICQPPTPRKERADDSRQYANVRERGQGDCSRADADPRERPNSVQGDRRDDQSRGGDDPWNGSATMAAVHSPSARSSASGLDASATTKLRSFMPTGPVRIGVRPAATRRLTMSSTSTCPCR
jgi:hypothetical protein